MTTATSGTSGTDDDVVTMEMVPENEPLVSSAAARLWFLVLAGVAGLALLAAVVVILLAPDSAFVWLVGLAIVLFVVIAAEIVLLLLARPKKAS